MKKVAILLNVFFVLVGVGFAQSSASSPTSQLPPATTQIMKVDEVRPGMKGVGYTVFQGTQPEPMGVEVLGVLRNLNGPKSDVVLVKLTGEKAEFTGVVAGMSGSPVYINGKLLGAIAYRIGQFSKEPIAGVTPIEQMLEINEFDTSIPQTGTTVARVTGATKTSTPGVDANPVQSYAQYLQPIDAPFVFNGFSEEAIKQFAPGLSAAGITPVMGVGSASKEKQPEPL
ncbi:MAG TPA: SpoIVB peptidase S55 domain-containing protein, partial [Candidatus Angelobacter sp.]